MLRERLGNAKGTLKITVPDRRNLTGNALLERLGNAKRNAKGTLGERKGNAKKMLKK